MFTLGQFLACLVVPAVLVLITTPLRRDLGPGWWTSGLAGALLALAAALGHFAAAQAIGDAVAPPVRGWHWFIPGALALGVVTLVPAGRWRGVLLGGAACLAVAGVLQPLGGMSFALVGAWAAAAAAAVVLAGWAGERTLAAEGPNIGHGLLLLVAAGSAAVIGLGGSKDLALLSATVASALGGSAILAVMGWSSARGLALPVTALLSGHLAIGAGYAETSPVAAGLVALALPLAALGNRWAGTRGSVIRVAVVVALVASAVVVAARQGLADPGYGGYGG
jgi:hypothetical protein